MIIYANSLKTMASTMAFRLHDHKRPELRYAQTGRGIGPKCSPCCCPWGLDVQRRVYFFFTIFFRREIRSSIFVSRPVIFRFALADKTLSPLFLPLQSGGHLIPETYCHLPEESDCLQTLFCCFQILERVGFTCATPIICIKVTPLFHS